MPTKYVKDDEGTVRILWSNPGVLTLDAIIDAPDKVTIECPNPDCEQDFGMNLDEPEDLIDMAGALDRNGGTQRCNECDEPLFGIYHDGDYDDGYRMEGWDSNPFQKPANGGLLKP